MRVLQINSVCGVGSTGRIATDIHNILVNQGHEGYIAYGRGKALNVDEKFTIRIGNKLDNYLHVAKTRMFDQHGLGSTRATTKFIEKIKQLDFDIIHLHNIHGYYINFEVLFDYLKHADIPVVWTLHDCWAFTGHCAYFDYAKCDNWLTECHDCPQKRVYPSSLVLSLSKFNFRRKKKNFCGVKNMTIVPPSNWLADLVKQSFLQEYPVMVINNGIDLEVFKPTDSDFRKKNNLEHKFIILGVANLWDKRKGLNTFLELSTQLNKDEIIVLVGVSNKQKELLPDNIISITRTDSIRELVDIYSAADVFVNPTLEDNFPTTNLESLACGTPVITFNTGGSVESVDDKTGIVVEQGDLDVLEGSIQNIKNLDVIFESKNLRQLAVDKYNKYDRFNDYVSLYKKVIK
jgi:glycosyltransferase involved in cell wall biosynthesis